MLKDIFSQKKLPSSLFAFFTRTTFRKEIVLTVTLKLLALFLLWECFFSHPLSKQLDANKLIAHFFS